MRDKITLKADWFNEIWEDENIGDLSEQEKAYIVYAAVQYGFSSEKINIGAIFGNEFKYLNMAMPNIYGQIDRVAEYSQTLNGNKVSQKYDDEAIKELRLQGFKAKEICEQLGYDPAKANSLTSNKGWKEAGEILKKKAAEGPSEEPKTISEAPDSSKTAEICTESVQSGSVNVGFNF